MKRRGLFRKLATFLCAGILGLGIFAGFGNVGYAATASNGSLEWVAGSGITLNCSGDSQVSWTSNLTDKTIVGQGKSEKKAWVITKDYSNTLTFTLEFAGTLSFDYSLDLQNGTLKIDGSKKTTGGTFSKEFSSTGGTLSVYLKTGSTSNYTKLTITNLALTVPPEIVTAHFSSNPHCVYKAYANEVEQELDKDISADTQTKFRVTLISLSDGYKFVRWKNNDDYVDGNTYEFSILTANSKNTISPFVTAITDAVFEVDDKLYSNLGGALNAANQSASSPKLITLVSSGTVNPREDESPYLFNGVSLFVPGEAGSSYSDYVGDYPPISHVVSDSPPLTIDYRLTIASGADLQFRSGSTLVVASKLLANGGGNMGSGPTTGTGEIDLESGAALSFYSDTALYCWGFIAGEGDVHLYSGAKLHEMFQFYWRGGTASLSLSISKKSFLFNQYSIQNVEANLTMEYGSSESCAVAFDMSGSETKTTIDYVGNSGMFILKDGSKLVRKYDAPEDRMKYQVFGNGSISHIKLKVSGVNFDSADYSLPIAANMDLEIGSGTVQTLQNLDFIPGVTLKVDASGTLEIGSKYTICLYDYSNWSGKTYATINGDIARVFHVSALASKDFAASATKRTSNKNGASITVEGKLQVSGTLVSTSPAETLDDVSKSGRVLGMEGGTVSFNGGYSGNGKSVSHKTYQYAANDKQKTISCITPNLVHGDGTYFQDSVTSNQVVCYQNAKWSVKNQGSIDITITYLNADGITQLMTKTYTIPDTEETLPKETTFTNFHGKIFLWLEKDNETTSYAPGYKINQFQNSITLVAFTGGWYTDLKRDTYYYDSTEGKVTGLYHVSKNQKDQTLYFDEEGILQSNWSGFFQFTSGKAYSNHGDDGVYYLENGVVSYQEGLRVEDVPVSSTVTKHNYYYFGKTGRAIQNKTLYLSASKLNGLLPEGAYTFGADSKLATLECSNFTHVSELTLQDETCYYGDIKAGIGLFESNGHIYYAKDDGSILKDATYYVSGGKFNGQTDSKGSALKEGLYYFDSNGHLCDSSLTPIAKEAQV